MPTRVIWERTESEDRDVAMTITLEVMSLHYPQSSQQTKLEAH